jgi:uncharacterized RDD family membrane protein YckC
MIVAGIVLRLSGFLVDMAVVGLVLVAIHTAGFEVRPEFGVMLAMLYYASMEAMLARTVGKLVTGTFIVTSEGNRPSVRTVLLRTLARTIPLDPLWALFGQTTTLHDDLTGTFVVRKERDDPRER